MRLTFATSALNRAPKGYTQVRLVEGDLRRLVREGGRDIVEVGTPKRDKVTRRKFVTICRSIIQAAKQNKAKKIAVQLSLSPFPQLSSIPLPELGSIIATAFEMANYEHVSYKSKPKEGWGMVDEVLICSNTPKEMQAGFKRGQAIGQAVNACRELANTPGGDMTPKLLAEAAHKAVEKLDVVVSVLDRYDIEQEGMGAVLGVAKGSVHEPQFIVMEYRGGGDEQRPVVLVGKGVTFDTGGLQVKGSDHMYEMHMDMSGGAAVIHAVALAAKLKVKANVVGLVPAVENHLGGDAMRPGDILTSLSGKTIEILDTDAEGRVILADALTYAKRYNPAVVADAATLTGAALGTLGQQASAIMTNDESKISEFLDLAEASGDYMWPLPMWEEYDYIVKGRFGDVPNIPAEGNTRYAGAIGGGKFLEVFAKDLKCPWIHIDTAPRMTSAQGDELAKGAAGAPVRFFLSLIERYAR